MAHSSTGLRLGFLAAMPSELRPLVRAASLRAGWIGALRVERGEIGSATVVAAQSGIGMRAAAKAAEQLLDAAPVDHVIVVGIAGGVGPTVEVGDVVVPELVVDGITGDTHRPAPLRETPARGILQTSDEPAVGTDDVARLTARGVVAVDMETSAIAAVCERRGCRWSVVRAISDRAGETPIEVFGLVWPDGSPNLAAVARYLFASPRRLPVLLRLGRDSSRAARAAAEAAVRACAGL